MLLLKSLILKTCQLSLILLVTYSVLGVFFITSFSANIFSWEKPDNKLFLSIVNVTSFLRDLSLINSILKVFFVLFLEVDLLRKMLQKEPELRISAAEALRHPYFTDSDDKIYVPKILMKQSGSCPVDLISN